MTTDAIDRLKYLYKIIPELLMNIHENNFSEKIRPEKWSKKEINQLIIKTLKLK